MNIESIPFREYPFSKLFQDYLTGSNRIPQYYEVHPFSDESLSKRVDQLRFNNDRNQIANALVSFNKRAGASEDVLRSIEKLRNNNSLAVVTGQQMILYGGPLFTIYKIITAIHMAHKMEKQLNRDVIPVFWLADEDHDYKEAATLSIPSDKGHQEYFFDAKDGTDMRISDIRANSAIQDFGKELRKQLGDTEFSSDLWSILDDCYAEGQFLGHSFGKLILKIFGKYGLILAGSNDKEIKKFLSEPLVKSVQSADEIESVLRNTSQNLVDDGYHSQVTVQHSNLFWIDGNKKRKKIQSEGDHWFIDGSEQKWNREELIQHINREPESFSPNVFLRPVVQNHIIPAIAYIAGPGEIAYYAQMKSFYHHFDQHMPMIIPRFSMTILESPITRIVEKLPFRIHDYIERIEDLEKMYIRRSDAPDIESIFQDWKKNIRNLSEDYSDKVGTIDPTLKKSADKTVSQFFSELDKLKGKLYRSVKEDESIQLKRIQKIQNHLFPNMNLQEREVAFIYIMNRYGMDIWDRLIELLKDQDPDSHKYLYL